MKRFYFFALAVFCFFTGYAQTDPAPQLLPFSFSAQTGGTLPAGMAVHRFGTTAAAIPTTRTLLPGNGDLPYLTTSNSGGWRDEGTNGIGILASGSQAAGALIVSINTIGQTNIQVSWTVRTILQQTSRDNSIALQYRIGTTGNFIDVGTTSTFSSAGTVAGASGSFTETLPAAAENQEVVQLRWIYWESSVGLTGSRDRLAVDDINIIATNSADTTPPVVTSFSPANGAIDIATSTAATIVFSETVQKGTGNILLRKTSDNSIVQTIPVTSTAVTINSNTVSLNITGLSLNTGYYIEITGGAIKDMAGNSFSGISGNATWAFTTGSTFYLASFQSCGPTLSDGFTQYSVTGAITWACTTFGRDPNAPAGTAPFPTGVQINGFANGTNVPNVDWLISPSFDLTATTYPLLSFWSRTTFNGAPLQLKVSTNYTGGNPAMATWTDINGKFPAQTSNVWTLSDGINLSAFKASNVHFAFVYTSTDEDGARWTIDDVSLKNSATPPPPSLTTSTEDLQFAFVASGASAIKSFQFTGNDLTGQVTVTATGPFLVSKDGIFFSSSLSYTQGEANNMLTRVYVRFSPTAPNQNFTGTITISTSGLTDLVSVKGTSIDPATTLEVVNWNIEWFGSPDEDPVNDNLQEQNVRTILQSIGADVYGLVEVVNESRLASVVSQMPGYAYVIGNYGSHVNPPEPTGGSLSEAQKLAFVYKTSVLSNVTARPLINNLNTTSTSYNNWSSGRYPFLLSADVTLNCVTKRVHFILVHAKANTSPTATSYARRQAAANELYDTIQQYFGDQHVIVFGDLNDDLDRTITSGINPPITSYNKFTSDLVNFFSPTLALSEAGKKSTVSHNDVIDHVILSNELQPYYLSSTAAILTDVTSLVSSYGSTTSDHYPVFTRYRFEAPTPPVVTSCPVATTLCGGNGMYTLPAFTASSVCGSVSYNYTITGATSRMGTGNDASGLFQTGTSLVTWTAVDAAGNSVSCQTTVIIRANPVVTIPDAYAMNSGVLPNTVYLGYAPASTLTFTATVSGGTPGYTYSWSSGSALPTAVLSPTSTTTYTVTVTDANTCQGTATKMVTVMDIRAGKNMNKILVCHKGNNSVEIDPAAAVAHLAHGDLLGGCSTVSPSVTGRNLTQQQEVQDMTIRALPNPSRSYFVLELNGGGPGRVQVRVTDLAGRTVELKYNLESNRTLTLGGAYLPGVYFVEISQGLTRKQFKLVKL